jgi:hypothetical protein
VLGFVQAIATLAGGGACILLPVFNRRNRPGLRRWQQMMLSI